MLPAAMKTAKAASSTAPVNPPRAFTLPVPKVYRGSLAWRRAYT